MRLPLEGLFLHLVRSGFPLSVRDYEDALVALRLGHGALTRERLHWLCETLWAHSDEERVLLRRLFRDFPQPTPEAIRTVTRAPAELGPDSATSGSEPVALEAAAEPQPRADEAPLLQFAAPEETGGIGLPQAMVPTTLLQPHILTPRPIVSLRSLIVAWRRFRLTRRTGPKVELDITATVAEKCRCGSLTEPVLIPARRNQARVLVLFDASPSMAPWLAMGKAVADSLRRALLGHAALYYFNNDPGDALFESDRLTRPRSLQQVEQQHPQCTVLVIGDAGAARGRADRDRVRSTRQFVTLAQQASWGPVAWLNPMPRNRWTGTSASWIAAIPAISMYELTEDGLVQAVDHLRGKERY